MTPKTPAERTRTSSAAEPDIRKLIQDGLKAATRMSSTGWIAIVSILAILLAGYAIHAILIIATRL